MIPDADLGPIVAQYVTVVHAVPTRAELARVIEILRDLATDDDTPAAEAEELSYLAQGLVQLDEEIRRLERLKRRASAPAPAVA